MGNSYDDVKLADFGLAKSFERISHSMTTGLGTLLYMAPEIFKGKSYTTSADIHSFSITIWEILYRKYPYDHITNKFELFIKVPEGERPQLNDNLSMEMSDLLTRCWNADASKRPTIDYILQFVCNTGFRIWGNRILYTLIHFEEKQKILLLGGMDGEKVLDTLLMLKNNGQNWKQLNIKLPYPIEDHGAELLNNNLYIFGGEYDYKTLNSTYKLSKSLQWEKKADMNEKRHYISNSSVILNNKIWVCGGSNRIDGPLKSVEMYDPETNEWKYVREMNKSRKYAAAAVVNGKIFCSGGFMHNSVECYDHSSDVWTLICNMPQMIWGHGAVEIDKNFIVMGGSNGRGVLKNVWALDTTNESAVWIDKQFMSIPRYYFSIAKIDDEIIVCGGDDKDYENDEDKTSDTVEIFDGEVWKNGPEMATGRSGAVAVVISMEFASSFN